MSRSVRGPVSASPAVDPMGTGRQKIAVTKRERAEESLHDAESGGSGTNWWYLEARLCRRHTGEICVDQNLERNVVDDDDVR